MVANNVLKLAADLIKVMRIYIFIVLYFIVFIIFLLYLLNMEIK